MRRKLLSLHGLESLGGGVPAVVCPAKHQLLLAAHGVKAQPQETHIPSNGHILPPAPARPGASVMLFGASLEVEGHLGAVVK